MNSLDALWDLNDFVISGISLYPFVVTEVLIM